MRKLFSSLFFLTLFHFSFSQQRYTLAEQKKFSSYLFEKHLYADCNTLLNQVEKNYSLSEVQRDSFNFFHAITFSKLEQNDSAADRFAKISPASSDYFFSGFNASLKLTEANKIDAAKKLLLNYSPKDPAQAEMKDLYSSALLLLNKDLKAFEVSTSKKNSSAGFFSLRNEELMKAEMKLKKANKKSAFLAGLMSTVVPGTGKIYSGKWRQGLMSMIPLTVMGLQAYEAYRIDGIKSARFIVFGGLFSVFYIGNIYGSAVSVSVRRTEIEHEVHDEVVLSMRMCLQHVFGQSY